MDISVRNLSDEHSSSSTDDSRRSRRSDDLQRLAVVRLGHSLPAVQQRLLFTEFETQKQRVGTL